MLTSGLIDNTFPQGLDYGFDKDVHDIKIQNDGKIIIGGDFEHYDYEGTLYVSPCLLRLNADGTFDPTFDITVGSSGFNESVRTIHIQTDGKILVGGFFTQLTRDNVTYNVGRIIRFNSDGTVDNTFSGGTGFNDEVYKIEVQDDGKIVVGGKFTQYDGQSYNRIIRLYSDGTIDPTFVIGNGIEDGGPAVYVLDVLKQLDGKLIAVGLFDTYDGNSSPNVVRILTGGGFDSSFNVGTGTNALVTTVGLQSTGKIILGGNFTDYNGNDLSFGRLVRINSDGSFSNSFSFGLDSQVTSLIIQSDDKIIVGGAFTKYYTSLVDFITANKLIKFLDTTSLDENFYLNPNYDDVFLALALTPNDGFLFLGGDSNYPPFNHFGKLINEAFSPIYVNPEYFMCVTCSGETSSVSVPHAIYSNGSGRDVVQLNTVALGGPNGLYN